MQNYSILIRYIALSTKPLIIFTLLYLGQESDAANFALLFTSISSIFLILNNQAHYDFYKTTAFIEEKNYTHKHQYRNYIRKLCAHGLIFFPLIIIISFIISSELFFFILILAIIEKAYDELLRFHLISQNWKYWSYCLTIKIIPAFLLTYFCIFFTEINPIIIFFVTSLASTVFLFSTKEKANITFIIKTILKLRKKTITDYMIIYKKDLVKKQFSSFLSGNILYIDKILILKFFNPEIGATYTLLAQIFSGVFLYIESSIFAKKRQDIILDKIKKSDYFFEKKYIFNLIIHFFISVVVSLIVAKALGKQQYTDFTILFLMGAIYVIYYYSLPVSEFIFWHNPIKHILIGDLLFYTIILIGILIFIQNQIDLKEILSLMLLAYSARLAVQAKYILRS